MTMSPMRFERCVVVETPQGKEKVTVSISTPKKYGRHGDWSCIVRFPGMMRGVNDDRIEICGIDALDAIASALHFLRLSIADKRKGLGWQVRWLARGDEGGFDPGLVKDLVPSAGALKKMGVIDPRGRKTISRRRTRNRPKGRRGKGGAGRND
jgi:hypothetical protein